MVNSLVDGTLKFDTSIDKSGFTVGLENLGSIAKKGMTAVGMASAAAVAGIAAIGQQAVSTGKAFTSGMSQVSATLGYSVSDLNHSASEAFRNMEKLTAKAEEMGAKTAFSASQAADGLNILAQSGYNADESIEMINSVLDMAAAGSLNLDSAASYIAGAMKGFTKEAGNFADNAEASAYYADLIAKGATLANTNVQQLGEALSQASSTANTYGQSAQTTETALLRLAEQNEVGSAAATALAAAMKNLYSPTEQAKQALDELGVSAYDANGKARDFNQIVDELKAALSQIDDESQRNAIENAIFGIQGQAAFDKMVSSSAEKVRSFYENLEYTESGAKGSAATQAETMLDNLTGDITILESALDGLKIKLFKNLDAPLRDAVQHVTTYISDLTNAVQTGGLDGLVSELGAKIPEAFDFLSGYLPKAAEIGGNLLLSLTGSFAKHLPETVGILAKSGKQLFSNFLKNLPNMAVIGLSAIEQLTSGIEKSLPELIRSGQNLFTDFSNSMQKKNLRFSRLGKNILKSVTNSISENLPMLTEFVLSLLNFVISLLTNSEFMENLANTGTSILLALADGLIRSVPIFTEKSPEIMQNLLNALETVPIAAASVADAVISAIASAFGLSQEWDEIKNILSEHLNQIDFDEIKLKIKTSLEILSEKTENIKQKIAEKFGYSDFEALKEEIKLKLEIAVSDIPENLSTLLTEMRNFGEWVSDYNDEGAQKFRASLEGIGTAVGTFAAVSAILPILTKFGAFIQFGLPVMIANLPNTLAGISGAFAGLGTALTGIILSPAGLVAALAALAGAFVYIAKTSETWQIGAEMIAEWEKKIADSYQNLIDAYAKAFEKDDENLQKWSEFWQGYGEYLADGVENAKQKFQNLKNNIADFFRKVKTDFDEFINNFWTNRLSDWSSGMDDLISKFSGYGADLVINFIDGIDSQVNPLHEAGTALGEMLYDMFHHSTPEEGYLKDDDTWMPDMMQNFAQGIEKNIPLVTQQADELAERLKNAVGMPVSVDFAEPEHFVMPEIPEIQSPEIVLDIAEIPEIQNPEIALDVAEIPEIQSPEIAFDIAEIPEIQSPEIVLDIAEIPEIQSPEIALDIAEIPEIQNPEIAFDIAEIPEIQSPEIALDVAEIPEIQSPEIAFDVAEIPKIILDSPDLNKSKISYQELSFSEIPELEIVSPDIPDLPKFPEFPDFPTPEKIPSFPSVAPVMPALDVPELKIEASEIRLPEFSPAALQAFQKQNVRMPDFFSNLSGTSEIVNNQYSYQTTNQTVQNAENRPIEATIHTTVELDHQQIGTAVRKIIISENMQSGGAFV